MEKKIYKVGGHVRDTLLGRKSLDIDYVAVGYSPQDFIDNGYIQVGSDFPVFLHPDTNQEYALARTERSLGDSTMDFKCNTTNVSLESDLERRDLNMNSMAIDTDGTIIDPFNGQEDIKKKLLRHTSDAFFEDPVRVLRLARFRAMLPTWKIDYGTKAMIYEHRDTLHSLQPERIWKEVNKALDLPHFHVFFETLFELGVLDIIFPSIHAMTTVKEGSKYHREASVFEHTMMMSRELTKQINAADIEVSKALKLAVLFHDIAKPITYRKYGCSAGHDDKDLVIQGIDYSFPNCSIPKKLKEDVVFLVKNHIKIYKMPDMKKSKVIYFLEEYMNKQHLIEDQISLALLDDIGRIQDESSKAKRIIDTKSLSNVVQKLKSVNAKDYMVTHPDAKPEQIKAHIHQLRAREMNPFYIGLKSI